MPLHRGDRAGRLHVDGGIAAERLWHHAELVEGDLEGLEGHPEAGFRHLRGPGGAFGARRRACAHTQLAGCMVPASGGHQGAGAATIQLLSHLWKELPAAGLVAPIAPPGAGPGAFQPLLRPQGMQPRPCRWRFGASIRLPVPVGVLESHQAQDAALGTPVIAGARQGALFICSWRASSIA